MQKTIKFIISIFFIFILVVFYLSLNRTSNYDTENLIGNKLEPIKLESFKNNNFFTNENLKKNNYTLINFWASWCAPCRIEHPFLMELSKEKNLKILGVNFKDKKNNALNFLNNLGNPYYYLAKDELGKKSVSFGIYGIPESILVNKELVVLKKFVGPLNLEDFNEIIKIINSL
ncbi:MAG: DsbE family thiol:disulfide interchange protein [Pseudomonadota bacterium]|nr:DsbE family thiol:disulfide interchange protein [Pseudomonadota bacterium]